MNDGEPLDICFLHLPINEDVTFYQQLQQTQTTNRKDDNQWHKKEKNESQ